MQRVSAFRCAISNPVLVKSAMSLACAVLVGFSALVRFPVPGTPVPATLQTFALLACAGMLGRWYALQMAGWYLALGAAGAPFFAGGAALGASAGYLAGFAAAAAAVGFLSREGQGRTARCVVYLAAALAIYVPGLAWLSFSTGSDLNATLAMGLYPFIAADIVKSLAACAACSLAGRK